jgi:GNAT superfamily N-acetyltransferase
LQYRPATPADAATLAAMNHQLIRDEGHRNPMTVAQLEARMAGWLGGEYQAVVFEDAGEPVGYALFRHEPEHVYLRQFFVRPDRRLRGVGRAAIEWLQQHIWGPERRVRVEVLVGNAAGIAFWRAVGFQSYCMTLEWEGGAEQPATTPGRSRLPGGT